MFEKIKIKATLASGKPWRSGGNNIISVLATFISDGLTKDEVDRLQAILKVIETGDQSLEKLVLNNVYLQPAVQPTPISNAVLAERIVELDRRLGQYMEVGKSHVESINGLIEEVTRLRGENTSLTQRNDSLRAAVENRDVSVRSYHAKIEGMTGDLATYEKRHAAMQAKVLDLQEENRVMDNLIAVKQKDLAHYTEVIADLKHTCSGYSGKIDALEKQVALQSSHAASLENQLADMVRDLEVKSYNLEKLNNRYLQVCETLRQYKNSWDNLTLESIGTRDFHTAFNTLNSLFKLFPTALMPKLVEPNPDKQHRVVECQAPAERGTEGY